MYCTSAMHFWPFRRVSSGNDDSENGAGALHSNLRRIRDIEMPESSESSRTSFGRAMDRMRGRTNSSEIGADGDGTTLVTTLGQAPLIAEEDLQRSLLGACNAGLTELKWQQESSRLHLAARSNAAAAPGAFPRPLKPPSKQTSLPKETRHWPEGLQIATHRPPSAGQAWGPPKPPIPQSPAAPTTSPMSQIVCHNTQPTPNLSRLAPPVPAPPSGSDSDTSPAPCPLRPCPPSSSGMRIESFTSGTGGRLLRPGVGIGPGTMREARPEDLRLIQQIGEGGFGKVYYGHWCGSPVAIKVATPHAEEADRQLQEFQREVTNMSTLPHHPNVLRLLAACLHPQHLALVTEFCSRGSLYNMLHTPGAAHLTPHQLLSLWLGVARGMQHLHACRVLHRDLKSANLLLDDMGAVKIGDFGLSRICSGRVAHQAMTGGLGTYQWMAPEVLTSQIYSDKADVYSFGMVMWECITGKLPYEGMTAMQAGLRVATQGLRPDIPGHVDPEQAQLIRDCWAPVSDQRPTFAQVVVRLEAMLRALEQAEAAGVNRQAASTVHAPGLHCNQQQHQKHAQQQQPRHQQQQQQQNHQQRQRQQMETTLPGQAVDQDHGPIPGYWDQWQEGQAGGRHEQVMMLVGPPPRPRHQQPGHTPVLV